MPYRLMGNGQKEERAFHLYAYSFDLDSSKSVRSLRLPENENALIFAVSLELQE
jgi:alpha-mannosidase